MRAVQRIARLCSSYNVSYYAVQLIAFVVPQLVSLVALGYTQPSSGIYSTIGTGLPTIAQTPQFQFSSVGSISTILGFVAGQNYPVAMPQLTSYNINSPNVPIGSTVNSIVVQCNLVSNAVSVPSDILDGIPITSSFGTNINYQPSFPKFVKIKDGIYNSFTITFSDQNLNTLFARDPNVSIVLMLRNNV